MGSKITVEEIRGKTDAEILAFEEDVVKDMKPEVKAIYQQRKDDIQANQSAGGGAAGGGAAAQDPTATTTPPAAAPAQEEVKADPSASAVQANEAQAKPQGWAKDHAGQKTLKLVLTGDTAVGKSCLITNYLQNSFTDEYEPTVLDVYRGIKNVQKKQIEIEIHDTSGDEHLGVNRKVQYKDADVFMICVAANNRESLENAIRWKAEISEIEQQKPIALILTKSDLMDLIEDGVKVPDVKSKQKELNLTMWSKTSSKAWEDFNVHKAFNKALAAAYNYKYMEADEEESDD